MTLVAKDVVTTGTRETGITAIQHGILETLIVDVVEELKRKKRCAKRCAVKRHQVKIFLLHIICNNNTKHFMI